MDWRARQQGPEPASRGAPSEPAPRGAPSGPAPRSRWWRRQPASAPRVVGIYAAVSLVWIALSDRVARALFPEPDQLVRISTLKGFAFIAITSALLFALIRQGEARVRGLAGELRATIDGMADGVLLLDERARIVEANRAAVELLGVPSKEELLVPIAEWGRRFALRYPDGRTVPSHDYASVRALAGERVIRYDGVVRRPDGREVFISVSAAPVPRPHRPPLAVTVLRDVSAAHLLEEMRDEFLATAAHEFKTPLAVVKAYAQLMSRREPREGQALAVIIRQVDRLTRLVDHLLDTSRLRVDADDGRRERFDLAALAREIVEGLAPTVPGHPLSVAAAAQVPVLADRDRIARVIAHLVDNAVRFSPGGGAVRAAVEIRGGEAELSVRDQGVGIPAERQAHVFERFYRAHSGTSNDYGGLGLGLEMSRAVVERHGGRMWFESAPGSGSTFHFTLPLAGEPA